MLVNILDSTVILIIDLLAMVTGASILVVYYTKRRYIGLKPYRKERGIVTVNETFILETWYLVVIILSLSLRPQIVYIGREGCLVILFFEFYCILAFFSWSFNDTLIAGSVLKLRMVPSLKIEHMYLIGYLLPVPFVTIFITVAALKSDVLACQMISKASDITSNATNIHTQSCSLDQCSISNNTTSIILMLMTFILPIAVGSFLTIVRLTRLCVMLWETWNSLKVKKNVKQRVAKFKSRDGIQRGILLTHAKLLLLFAASGVLFAGANYKEIFKGVFSTCLAATIIVIFINNCIICEKVLNPLSWIEDWWKAKFCKRNNMKSFQSPSLNKVYELTQISTPQLRSVRSSSASNSHITKI